MHTIKLTEEVKGVDTTRYNEYGQKTHVLDTIIEAINADMANVDAVFIVQKVPGEGAGGYVHYISTYTYDSDGKED